MWASVGPDMRVIYLVSLIPHLRGVLCMREEDKSGAYTLPGDGNPSQDREQRSPSTFPKSASVIVPEGDTTREPRILQPAHPTSQGPKRAHVELKLDSVVSA